MGMWTVLLAAGAVLVAVVAWLLVISATRKFQALSQSHWELRFEFARLRARVAKLDGGSASDTASEPPAGVPPEA